MTRFVKSINYCILLMLICFLFTSGIYSQEIDSTQETSTDSIQVQADTTQMNSENIEQPVFTPGDALQVTVYPDTVGFPNGIYSIDDKGYVDFPIIGYKNVTNKNIDKLESLLKTAYVNYLPQPNIQVKPLIRVSLLGGFSRPGLYLVDPRESMWMLINRAGGTAREDGIEKLRWRRNRQIVTKDCVPFVESGQSLESIGFKSGDQITVTQRPKQRGWDVFRTDVLPLISFTISTLASAATIYMAYERYQAGR